MSDNEKTAPQIARQIGISIRSVRIDLKALRDGGFITKETESTRSPWVVLKKGQNISPPRAACETDEDRLAFLVTIPVHEGCENRLSSETGSETGSETPKRTIDKILRIIKERPGITNAELANILCISPRAVGKHLKKQRDDNRIVRVGSPTYGGGWETLEEQLRIAAFSLHSPPHKFK